MAKTRQEIETIIERYVIELQKLGIPSPRVILYGSYKKGTPREESDIDLIVISEGFRGMDLRQRLELLGLAAGRILEPIEALGYTPEEIQNVRGTFLEAILEGSEEPLSGYG